MNVTGRMIVKYLRLNKPDEIFIHYHKREHGPQTCVSFRYFSHALTMPVFVMDDDEFEAFRVEFPDCYTLLDESYKDIAIPAFRNSVKNPHRRKH